MSKKKDEMTDAELAARRAYDKRRYDENREEMKAKSRAHHQARKDDPDFKAKANKRAKEWYEAHKDDPTYKETRDARGKAWRDRNREHHLAWRSDYAKRKRAENREEINAKKRANLETRTVTLRKLIAEAKSSGCLFCSESDPVALDFHHVDPDAKRFLIQPNRIPHKSLDVVREEIAKCVVLCANCHRKYHAGVLDLPDSFPEEWRHWDAKANHWRRRRARNGSD